MLEDDDPIWGTKRSWEAVSQWGESGVDSTTTVLYPHKKTRPTHGSGVPGTVSSQHIGASGVDNNTGAEICGINGFEDERQARPENEARDDTLATARSTKEDLITTGESLETFLCDTCFGMVILEGFQLKNKFITGKAAKDVKLEVSGIMVIVRDETSNSYEGLLDQISAQILVNLVKSYNVELKASLKTSKIIEVLIYGQFEQGDAIGNMLLEQDCFLQQPDSYDVSRPYHNPQCFSYSGKEDNLFQETSGLSLSRCTILGESDKSKATELLDCAIGPTNFRRVQTSRVITTALKPYQSKALAMMMEKESGDIRNAEFPSVWVEKTDAAFSFSRFYNTVTQSHTTREPKLCLGGLLADDMGLGKTLTTLALIATSLNNENKDAYCQVPCVNLIVCPVSTITGWQDQIERHFKKGSLSYSIYHGSARHKVITTLKTVDIVFTTYETLRAELPGRNASIGRTGILHGIDWHRVVLDEAHVVRNRASKMFQAVRMLKAKHRWCLTGTPIQNRLEDLGALVEFLRVDPFDDPDIFKHTFLAPIDKRQQGGWERLRSLIKSIALRRTKASVDTDLDLPPRSDLIHYIHLNDEERTLYNLVKRGFALAIESGGATMNTFQFILRLRQICNHGSDLLPGDLQDWLQDATCLQFQKCESCGKSLDHEDESSYHVFSCFHQVCRVCLQSSDAYDDSSLACPLCNVTALEGDEISKSTRGSKGSEVQPLRYFPSSKVKALLQNLHSDHTAATASDQRPAKSIIFSTWTGMLDLIGRALSLNSFTYQRLDGSKSLAQRRYALEEFRTNNDCTILLASLGSAAVGLDLTMASRVHLMEPGWNPLIEQQAMDRVYRLGQKNEVITTRYIVSGSDSIEQASLQWAKMDTANRGYVVYSTKANLENESHRIFPRGFCD
ncbi:SNF2 family N-terminal domain-containing protein [Daldinia decipiens]|uniref:SNF2 family N-terminal domain-containing protein n=1 Tax=Daldinia decipiens TaxID=326647 RepID=UPI0020C2B53D|nr:SNF2 family N-terminal domain-containing protein [Daldinia decipiens]KAI1657871.1 SNF2 family N-terminal domain-containing protein [Daldinia decipiens]